MASLITCPHCGVRPKEEFSIRGDASPVRPAPGAPDDAWYRYVFIRDNPKGRIIEHWHHSAGCPALACRPSAIMREPRGLQRDRCEQSREGGRTMSGFRLSSGGSSTARARFPSPSMVRPIRVMRVIRWPRTLIANDQLLVGRSFKYHRPRGIVTAGSAEPNALVTIGAEGRTEPNTRADRRRALSGARGQ